LPSTSDLEPDIEQYLCSLDKVLEDRRVTAEEADELLAMAGDCGVTRDRAVAAHEAYMREMLRVALEDGVITELEREDLEVVRLLLGIGSIDYERLLEHARNGAATLAQPTQPPPIEGRDLQGKKICFTGMLRGHIKGTLVTRPLAEQIASEHGMIVLQQVTKKLDFLVTADPDSMSGKARKARDYGVRIIAEPVFWKMVGIQTQ
jgi:DNA polymerase-3 subunit epsilon